MKTLCSHFWSKKNVNSDEEDVVVNVEGHDQSPEKNVPEVSSSGASNVLHGTDKNGAQLFTYSELVSATNNFETKIGEGGFGPVYKGRLERTNQVIAVKRLNRQGPQGETEFLAEVLMLSVLRHPNLITLIGYCSEDYQCLLVYEYMPLGSLADHLYDSITDKEPLDWNTRMEIATGVAKGVEYLHHQADPPVIHRDLKPSNILLGDGFHPKLSDFGLAIVGPTGENAHIATTVFGTYGYCAREYAVSGKLTTKSDIFSFGIVLLELVTGRHALDDTHGHKEWLIDWVQPLMEKHNIERIADPRLRGEYPKRSMDKVLNLAAAMCIKEDIKLRPSMAEVVSILDELASHKYKKVVVVDHGQTKVAVEKVQSQTKKGLERERAVAEAKKWGESCRRNKLAHSV